MLLQILHIQKEVTKFSSSNYFFILIRQQESSRFLAHLYFRKHHYVRVECESVFCSYKQQWPQRCLNLSSVLQSLVLYQPKYSQNSLLRANTTNFSFDLVNPNTVLCHVALKRPGNFRKQPLLQGSYLRKKQETNGPHHSRD